MLEQPHFGRQLRKLRLERGLSQAAVVGEGMSTGYLSRLESGERRPTGRVVAYLAQQLGVAVSALTEPRGGGCLSRALAVATSAPPGTDSAADLLQAVRDDERDDPAGRWQALWLLSRISNRDGDYEQERGHLLELMELSDMIAAPELRVRSNVRYARCLCALGEVRAAEPAAVSAVAIARGEHLPVADTMAALMVLIAIETELGRLDAADRHVREMERDLLPAAASPQAAEALWTASVVSARQGDHATARSRLEAALGLLQGGDGLTLWTRLRTAAAAAAVQMSPPRVEAAERWLNEAATILELVGTPSQLQELGALRAHIAFHQGRLDDARAQCHALLSGEDLRLPYGDRVRLAVLEGRLMILEGRTDQGVAALRRLGQQATDARNLDLATHVWQSLATTLADVRAPGGRGRRSVTGGG
ncbi:helix-turn-helix domain-containing protein [Streptomyces sp. NPDC006314]|uniref:helix-turn-helix domain-containing protein n=1 Tax=Streptomyces sp. NPDC006314 TaxID=3154475 RepID=UPI0033B31090